MELGLHLLELARHASQVSVKTIVKRQALVPYLVQDVVPTTIIGLLLNKHARGHGQPLKSFTVFDRRIKLV